MSGPRIHPTAIVAEGADLAAGVTVGPYSVIGARVRIGAETTVAEHVVITGRTTLGRRNQIFPFASLGNVPQDLKYQGEDSELMVGDGNRIREFCTLHPGTQAGGMVTRVGDGNLLMNYAHVAHDCIVGSRNVVANGVQLGGHVTIEDHAVVGALSGIHQFVRIGESSIIGAGSMVSQDVPPFCNATGDRAELHGLNGVGLKRRGFSEETVRALKQAYRLMFQSKLRVAEAVSRVRAEIGGSDEVERFVAFIESSERGVCRPSTAAARRSG
jgi:UDP-N-acetylglucosamine acyltransferase